MSHQVGEGYAYDRVDQRMDMYPTHTKPMRFIIRLVFFVAIYLALIASLIVVYARPYVNRLDLDTSTSRLTGTHSREHNDEITFAYTQGQAFAWFRGVGVGTYAIRLRMGGPGATEPVTAHLQSSTASLDLGSPVNLRVYDVLVPSDRVGNVNLQLVSNTRKIAGDSRQLGLLLDYLELRSLTAATLPLFAYVLALVPLLLVLALWQRFPVSFGTALGLFAAWRIATWVVGFVGLWWSAAFYPVGKALSYHGEIVGRDNLMLKALVSAWSQWDSQHYESIAMADYSFFEVRYPTIAFFPLYPMLVRGFTSLTRSNVDIAALVVTHLALLCALVLLHNLLRRDFSPTIARRTLVLLLVFPTSLFFGAAYSESLALALVAAAVWAMRARRWWLAGIAGAFLTLTRLPGIMIAAVLLVAYLQDRGWRWRAVRPAILSAALPPLALGLFMGFQQWRFGTPFAFLLVQERWDQHLSFPWTMPVVLVRSIFTSYEWPVIIFQAVVYLVFLGLTVLALRRLPLVYSLTLVLMLVPPYLSNFPGSLPRYVLMSVPAFVLVALLLERRREQHIVVGAMLPLTALAIVLFVNGFWVG